MRRRVIVTGANGVVGDELMRQLVPAVAPDWEILAIFSSQGSLEAYRARNDERLLSRIKPLVWDLRDAHALADVARAAGPADVSIGIHSAADVSWHRSLEKMRPVNVEGSRQVARLLRETSRSARLIYVSSAFTSVEGWEYRNSYERSKAEAERMLKREFPDLTPITFSCSLVVGRSEDGGISAYHGLYPMIRAINQFEPPIIPGNRSARVDIVPVDWVASELLALFEKVASSRTADDVVAAAGENSARLDELALQIHAALDVERAIRGIAPLPEMPVRSFRQFEFLKRTMKTWKLAVVDERSMQGFERLLALYRPYLEDDRALPARGVTRPAPRIETYLPRVVARWLEETWKRRPLVAVGTRADSRRLSGNAGDSTSFAAALAADVAVGASR